MSEVRDQTPPADELAAVRAEIKALEAREGELRQLMMSDPSSRTGNRFAASIQETHPERTDLKELRAKYPEIVAEYTFKRPVTTVVLKAIDQETGELLHIRKSK